MKPQYERERRFLVAEPKITEGHEGNVIVQAYLFAKDGYSIRVRRTHQPSTTVGRRHDEGPAILTAKGPRVGGSREEYEMQVPVKYAIELVKRADHKILKTRYQLVDVDRLWDVDIFHGDNEGLSIAECEGNGLATLTVPRWCGLEVTDDPRYDNESLAEDPFRNWNGRSRPTTGGAE